MSTATTTSPDAQQTIRRTIHPEIKVIDPMQGLVRYVASDQTIDSYREVVSARGWRFNLFDQNAPFVNSHNYGSIEQLLGKVVEFGVENGRLVETVQWAINAGLPSTHLANIGFRLVQSGYLPAVSVGFRPIRSVYPGDGVAYKDAVNSMGLDKNANIARIYLEQEQIELSAVIIGANPNALALGKAFKAGAITEADLESLANVHAQETGLTGTHPTETAAADDQRVAAEARMRNFCRGYFLRRMERAIKSL